MIIKMNNFPLLLAIIFCAGCSTQRNVNNSGHPSSWVEPVRFEADVNPSQRAIHGDGSVTRVLGLFNFGDSKYVDGVVWDGGSDHNYTNPYLDPIRQMVTRDLSGKAKKAAAYRAVTSSNADFLLVPRYEVEEKNYVLWRTAKARVSGLPGHYEGLRQIPGYRSQVGGDTYVPNFYPDHPNVKSVKEYTPFDKRASSSAPTTSNFYSAGAK